MRIVLVPGILVIMRWEYLEFMAMCNVDVRNFIAGNNRKNSSVNCFSLVPTTVKFNEIILTNLKFKDEAYEVLGGVDDFEKQAL